MGDEVPRNSAKQAGNEIGEAIAWSAESALHVELTRGQRRILRCLLQQYRQTLFIRIHTKVRCLGHIG